ncbi:hypothetical protein QP940_10125 [Corynebacterium pseudodiphtheriticum]|uniref:hypothetical protein n=1 Tax=Corynebacterium pseudodiphtheriticum TaxID=37637 RepID=UPI00254D4F93|nr:hypothetical protein [Corynebacterium pseudodiphtheriticum]MDK8615106.1 hypothetical protein [Corynebacterium pseudodiphtheriticum]MDK8739046.1 hypothetical protein [Corynebacterium pseudodiphtheriticum]MDK8745586.1 hypothetical protein [Corynebacterium pseudodiphtheriticum]
MKSVTLIAGISLAFEIQMAIRIFIDVDGQFSVVILDDPASFLPSKWLPHLVFLIFIISLPSLWEYWLPDSLKEIRMELEVLNSDIKHIEDEISRFNNLPLVKCLDLRNLEPKAANRPKPGILSSRKCVAYGVALVILEVVYFFCCKFKFAQFSLQPYLVVLIEISLLLLISLLLILQFRKVKMGWEIFSRVDRSSEVYYGIVLFILWFIAIISLFGTNAYYIYLQTLNNSGTEKIWIVKILVVVIVGAVLLFILISVIMLSFKKPGCLFGIRHALRALAFSKKLELQEDLDRKKSKKKLTQVSLARLGKIN